MFALHSFLPLLGNSYVKCFSDSQSACKIIQVGGMRNDLHAIALEIFRFCANSSIHIVVQWIPCTEIVSCLWRKADGFIQWIVLLVIITRRLANFSLDFGNQVVAG